jgi:hypothetical protein
MLCPQTAGEDAVDATGTAEGIHSHFRLPKAAKPAMYWLATKQLTARINEMCMIGTSGQEREFLPLFLFAQIRYNTHKSLKII